MCWHCHHAIICGENKQIWGWPKLHLMQLFSWPPIAKTSQIQAVNSFGCCSSKRARGSEVGQWCKEILIYGAYCYILWLGTVFTQPLPLFKAISTGHKLGDHWSSGLSWNHLYTPKLSTAGHFGHQAPPTCTCTWVCDCWVLWCIWP